jgi:predicted RNase H-like HicB family nuclease
MSDRDTAEAALLSLQEAIAEWIEEAQALGRAIPRPSRRIAAAE